MSESGKETRWTEGPWLADVALRCVAAQDGSRAPPGRRVIVADTGYEGISAILSDEESAANTRLIAAAPALYEALAMVRDADEDCKRDGLPTIPPMARAKIDAALLLANTGGTDDR